MGNKFISENAWSAITAAAKSSPAHVAVAYFGRGAAKLLPLKAQSVLVVDASERAVKSGQTCPQELLALIEKGVCVYSISNLHAKVFSFGRIGFVGSTNVSHTSAEGLVEAVIRTDSPGTVAEIRDFVRGLAVEPVGPEYAKKLQGLYQPPKFGRGRQRSRKHSGAAPKHAPLRVLHTMKDYLTEEEAAVEEVGRPKARRKLRPRFGLDTMVSSSSGREAVGEHVLIATHLDDGLIMVSPPGRVLHVQGSPKIGRTRVVFLEIPVVHRKSLQSIGKLLGKKIAKRLRREGPLSAEFTAKILSIWPAAR